MSKWTLPGVALVVLVAWLLWPKLERSSTVGVASSTGEASERRDDAPTVPAAALDLHLAGRAAIAGTVFDPKGAPFAGAQVCARPGTSRLRGEDARARHCAISERDGHYRIDGLFGVPHVVNAAAPGFVPVMFMRSSGARRHEVPLRPGAEARDIDLTLEGGGVEIQGVVEDLSGGIVEGAEVSHGGIMAGTGMAFTHSGPDGAFSLWVRPGRVDVRAEAEGYAQGGDGGPAPGHHFQVMLIPEAVLIGKVVRASDGSPVAGAEILVERWSGAAPVLTDEGGNFRVGGLRPGAYKPQAKSDDSYGVAAEQVLLGLGETSEVVVIQAHPAFFVEGKIVTADGRACEDGTLTLSPAGGDAISGGTQEDGLVHVAGVLPGEYAVNIQCIGFLAAEQYPAVRVESASIEALRWPVETGRAIRGVIVDPRGKPVPRLNVSARPKADADQPRARTSSGRSERSHEQGRFEVSGLLPGAYELVIFSYSESRARPKAPTVVTVLADHDLEGVRIEMPAVGELRGRVRDTQGRGIARASIDVSGPQGRQGMTADDGSYRVDNIAVGSYRVHVMRGSAMLRAPGKDDDAVQGEPVEIEAGAVTTLDLVVADPSGTITGVVREADGAPVQDAYVTATRESESAAASGGALANSRIRTGERPILSDVDGRFRVEGLPPGKYTLQAQRPRGGDAVREHVELGGDVILAIAPASRLAGTVALRGGGAPDEFSVSIRNRARGYESSDRFFRTGGAWGFGEVPPGDIEVQVSAVDGTQKLTVELGAGEQKSDLRVELAAKVTVRGIVVDLEGAPLVGVEVNISETGSFNFGAVPTDRKQVTDEAGRFEVARAATGLVTVLVGKPGDSSIPFTVLRMTIAGDGPVVELAPLRIGRARTRPGEDAGDLGYVLRRPVPGTPPDQVHHVVAVVRPGGPAALAGLRVGDEIVAVDGHDVTGASTYLHRTLSVVSEGTTVQLGLARGATIAVTAAKRP